MLSALDIEYPVGRSGARFSALLPTAVVRELDTAKLRYFVVEDDNGHRYPATIDEVAPSQTHHELSAISGAVVAGGGA